MESGHRLVLSFALCHDGSVPVSMPSCDGRLAAALAEAFDECAQTGFLIWEFAQQYTQASLETDGEAALKGTDRQLFAALRAVAPPLWLGYGSLKRVLSQSGSGWGDVMEEVLEEDETLSLCDVKPLGKGAFDLPPSIHTSLKELQVEEEYLVNGIREWSEREEVDSNVEATGNEGVNAEYTYKRVVLCVISAEPRHDESMHCLFRENLRNSVAARTWGRCFS